MNAVIASRIYNLVSTDPVKIAILNLLADGKWHKRFEVEMVAKDLRPTMGLVGIATIFRMLQNADSELIEIYDNDSGVFYRLNPQRMAIIRKILEHLQTPSRGKQTSSSRQFELFKERMRLSRQKTEKVDDDLKQFL